MTQAASRGVALPAESSEWESPPALVGELWTKYGPFELDPACRPHHYTAGRVLNSGGRIYVPAESEFGPTWQDRIEVDGGAHDWTGPTFCNPPFPVADWVAKGVAEVEAGRCPLLVMLLPANKTEQPWWQKYVVRSLRWSRDIGYDAEAHARLSEIVWLPGRQKYQKGETSGPAGFASCVVVWRR